MRVDRDASASESVSYWPVDIKNHRATQRVKRESHVEQANLVVNLDLSPSDGTLFPKRFEPDCIQLAHYYRHLDSLGYADPGNESGAVWGGVIDSRGMLAWFDLNTPAHTTTTPQVDDDGTMSFHRRSGKTSRTSLERYDFEFAFRLDVADAADTRTSASPSASGCSGERERVRAVLVAAGVRQRTACRRRRQPRHWCRLPRMGPPPSSRQPDHGRSRCTRRRKQQ